MLKLTPENYYSKEASQEYMSVSQYKNFVGTWGQLGCEAKAMAMLRGEWEDEVSPSMLVGSFVDAHFEGTLGTFKAQHPEIFTKNGDLKAEYRHAEAVIARIERDEYFMKTLSGEKQRIFTGDLYGVTWKCKVDSYIPGACITDLKVMKCLRDTFWVKDLGRMSFAEYWGYILQGAVYQKLVEIETGEKLPFLLSAASKEEHPDIQVIGFTQQNLDDELTQVFKNIGRVISVKKGEQEPLRCEVCDYCRETKKLDHPIHYSELETKIR